jgi:hypothetical protein
MTSSVSCCERIVNQNKWQTLLHGRAGVTTRYVLWFSFENLSKWLVKNEKVNFNVIIFTFPVCWRNRHHKSSPFLECRPSKLYFKILWKYDDWWFRFHHFLENGWFYRENTYKCSPLVTKWQIILHFHC